MTLLGIVLLPAAFVAGVWLGVRYERAVDRIDADLAAHLSWNQTTKDLSSLSLASASARSDDGARPAPIPPARAAFLSVVEGEAREPLPLHPASVHREAWAALHRLSEVVTWMVGPEKK